MDLGHPAEHPAEERSLLVLPEIEVVLQVELVEELVEARVGHLGAVLCAGLVGVLAVQIVWAVAHQASSAGVVQLSRTSRTMAGPTSSSRSLKSTQPVA